MIKIILPGFFGYRKFCLVWWEQTKGIKWEQCIDSLAGAIFSRLVGKGLDVLVPKMSLQSLWLPPGVKYGPEERVFGTVGRQQSAAGTVLSLLCNSHLCLIASASSLVLRLENRLKMNPIKKKKGIKLLSISSYLLYLILTVLLSGLNTLNY